MIGIHLDVNYSKLQLFEDVSSLDMILVCVNLVGLEDISRASCLVIDYFS